VLIVSGDAVTAALVGVMVETLGYTVKFATATEGADASLRRAHPRIYMIDCATTEMRSDEVIARAIMRGASVVLFGPAARLETSRGLAARHEFELVTVPLMPGPLGHALDRAARKSGD
jgi:DNA-binding NtrC family response regulator